MRYLIKTEYNDGVNLKEELKNRKLSYRQFADISGIHFVSINRISNGARCTEEVAERIKKSLPTHNVSNDM